MTIEAISDHLQHILDNLPTRPGTYLMKDKRDNVIYVGKAVNLRSRVRSYFQPSTLKTAPAKHRALVANITDIEFIVVESELEALLTEINLIKAHKPRYNVRLKDDKRYPYIKVEWANDFPKVHTTRRMRKDGSRYFGPYTNAKAVYQTLDALRKAFPFLTCDRDITGNDERACLYYDIKLCNAPCIGKVNREEYRETIQSLMDFLQGDTDEIIEKLEAKMLKASQDMDYEMAARYRDQLYAIEKVIQKQRVVSAKNVDQDVIAFAQEENDAVVQIFFIRRGKIIGREHYVLEGTADEDEQEIVSEFVKQFYDEAADIPQEVLLPHEMEEATIIEQWLRNKRGKKVALTVPQRGQKRELLKMAADNATETLSMLRSEWETDTLRQETALKELQEALDLPELPVRMECFDISNTQGTAVSASRVVFVQGVPKKSEYRKFNIRTITNNADDYGSMREALTRRFQRWADAQNEDELAPGQKVDDSWRLLPDLLIVDGGKGQLGVAVEVLKEFQLTERVPVCGLAKQREEIFQPGKPNSTLLPQRSQGLYLMQRIRDEAHRFAITHHRKRRQKKGLASTIEQIPGVGPARRKALLKAFGSLKGIREASEEQIAEVPGIGAELAAVIKAEL